MSFNKYKNLFKGISNAVEATSKEEEIHGRFGIVLYNIIKNEQPELFDEEFYKNLIELAQNAIDTEIEIIDWIFASGDLGFITKKKIENYIKNRYNSSLNAMGIESLYDVDPVLLKETQWFDIEILSTKETDFFNKRSTDYSKKNKQITPDDLF